MEAGRGLRTLGSALIVAGLVGAAIATPHPARAAEDSPESWTSYTAIPGALTNGYTPALASFDGYLYAAWVGQSSPYHIYYARFNGSTWSAHSTIPSALTTRYTEPSLAVYEGDLYAAWTGQSSPYNLWFAGFNGSTWTGQTEVPQAATAEYESPAIASYDGYLWFAWIGASHKSVWDESVEEGGSWSGQAKIPPASSGGPYDYPSLASYDGDLFALWYQPGPAEISYATYNLTKWSAASVLVTGSVPGVLEGTATAVRSSTLYVAWWSELYGLEYLTYNGSKWSGTSAEIPSDAEGPPALAGYDGSLYAAWDGSPSSGSSTIDYTAGP